MLEDTQKLINNIKTLTGESDEQLLSFLLEKASNQILVETNRTALPKQLEYVVVDYTLYLYNVSSGTGESSRSEGGISVSYTTEIPPHISNAIRNFKLARVGGYAFEKK